MLGDYENFLDMINGGGAGRAGQRFEGGGLLSEIANIFALPYGYEERLSQARPRVRPTGLGAPPPVAPAPSPITPMMRGEDLAMSMPVAPYSPPMGGGRAAMGPQRLPQPLTFEEFVAGLGPVAQAASPLALQQAYDQFLTGY
jgi:hypothetical protein